MVATRHLIGGEPSQNERAGPLTVLRRFLERNKVLAEEGEQNVPDTMSQRLLRSLIFDIFGAG